MTQWTAFFILCLAHGSAETNNICETEHGTISDACSDEGNSFLQRTGSAASPKHAKRQDYHKLLQEVEIYARHRRQEAEEKHKEAVMQDMQPADQQLDHSSLMNEAFRHLQEEEEEKYRDQPDLFKEVIMHVMHKRLPKQTVMQDKQPHDQQNDQPNLIKEAKDIFQEIEKDHNQAVMQDMQKREEDELASTKITEIEGIDCETMNKPLQVMRGPDGFNVKELDIGTGTYSSKFLIPWDVATGGYSDLNACSIHPADSVLYCVVFAGAPYLVRIDATPRMEFVGRLPWGTYISGAFAPMTGRLYIATLNAGFLVIDNVISMRAFSSKADAADLRSLARTKPSSWVFTADCVVIEKDLEGNGVEEYLFSLYGPRLQIAK